MVMRYVRTQKGDMFIASTAVIQCEAFKMMASFAIILYQEKSVPKSVRHLVKNIIDQPVDCIRMSIPAVIYVFQNNLFYVAVSNLDAATCQVTYQLKIFTTAICSVIMLKTKISRLQWISLCILFVGVSVVLLPSTKSTKGVTLDEDKNRILGIICVVTSCCLSGFSGVYFEKILKGTKKSIWLRNVQLGMFGIAVGFITMGFKDGIKVFEKGFFHGYYSVVWFVIFLQSFGGLCTAVVVKYANNILKGFATSGAIVLSCIISVYLFDFHLTKEFTIGALLVVLSVFMYSKCSVK
ncbi:SLC35A1_2_3 [Mytilus edulis]|uniref:SLC35A1_2_3 n=1 Tax=Mytilus edulis TaxID=6550 RepID=A0A8S3QPY9_MYTED|nr:SLC35A1_2_3 [Mytilus edulis]